MIVFTSKSLLDYPQLVPSPPNSPYFIQLDLNLQHEDLDRKTIKYLVNFQQIGFNVTKDGSYTWDRNIDFDFFPNQLNVKKGQLIKPYKFEVDLLAGSSKDYPFDTYYTGLAFFAYDNSTNQTIELGMSANVRTISTDKTFNSQHLTTGKGDKAYYFEVIVYRSTIVYMFCFLVSFVTWILTILMLNLAYDTLVHKRELPPPILSLGVAISFALPTLRRTQPGIPDVGCAIDYLCFFWCETLVALSTCIIIGCYTLRYNKQK